MILKKQLTFQSYMPDDVKELIREEGKKTRRHFDVVAESLRSDIKAVAEGVEVANQRLDRLEPLVEKVDAMKDDVEAIKVTTQSIQHDLKRKADREELTALEVKLRPA